MILNNTIPVDIKEPGDYILIATVTSGTVTFFISMDNEPFEAITDGAFSATQTATINLPRCRIRADYIDGSAQLKLQNRAR